MQLPGLMRKANPPTQRRTAETATASAAATPAATATAHAEASAFVSRGSRAGTVASSPLAETHATAEGLSRTAVADRPGVLRAPGSGLHLAHPDKVNLSNALNLMKVCKEAYTDYNYNVGHTQFLYREYADHQVISYSGSKELKDWGHDANIVKMKYRDMGWVHSGFAKAYEEIRDLQDTVIKKDKPLVVSGHSLGGATATVAALDLKQRGYDVHSVYTYGSPRVGYSDFKEIYEGAKIPTYRFVNAYDVVPRIPKINYHHVGEPYFLTTDGKIQDRQQSAWNLWPWQVPQQRVESHHLPNYMANLQKYIA